MRRSHAGTLFATVWFAFTSTMIWFDLHKTFQLLPYWFGDLLLLGYIVVPFIPFVLVRNYTYPRIVSGALALSTVLLMLLPFAPSIDEIALQLRSSHIHAGMSLAETEAIMAGYRGGMTQVDRDYGTGDLVYCADDTCDMSVYITFDANRVVRTRIDTD